MQRMAKIVARLRGALLGRALGVHSRGGLSIGTGCVISRGTLTVGRGVTVSDRCSLLGSISLGDSVFLHRDVILRSFDGVISIGEGTTVNPFTVMYGKGGVNVGSLVSIAPGVVIAASNKNVDDTLKPMKSQGERAEGVSIGDDVWVGANAVILDGVSIGRGAIVAAGAVVTRDVPEFAIVAGVPARVLRVRGVDDV